MVGGVLSIVRLTGARVAYLERQELDEYGLRLPEPGQQLGFELEAYLGEGARVVGRWQGLGADALGLGERVREGQLAALLAGVNPVSGELLGRRFTQRERLVAVTDPVSGERVLIRQALDPVGGWDLVFAAPKSVSLVYALGSEAVRAEVLAAHEAAVTAALGMLERHAAYTRRARNGVILEPAAGVVVARFDHELARRVEHADGSTTTDPHLHTHCALLGKALSQDGQWRALRHPLIIGEWQKPLGAAYRAHLRSEITERLGWAWEGLDARGLSELSGWDSGVLLEMSQRRRQVEARLVEAWGTSEGLNGRQTRSAALETRAVKSPAAALEVLQADWRARLAEHGLERDALDALVAPAEFRRVVPRHGRGELEAVFARLAGERGLTEKENTFTRANVVRSLAEALPRGAPAETLEQLTDLFLADARVLGLAPAPGTQYEALQRFTMHDLLRVERSALGLARERDAQVGVIPGYAVAAQVSRSRVRLSDEQREAVKLITQSGRPVDLLDAAAGTGKTTTLGVLAAVYRGEGCEVIGLAPSARAARELHQAGVASRTIDSHLLHLQHEQPSEQAEPASRRVVIVDEAGMIGTRNLARLLDEERARDSKIILAGDPAQLPSVAAGGVFAALCREDSERAQLRQVQRQRDAQEIAALAALRNDTRGSDGVEAYLAHKARRGEITITRDQHDATRAAREWWASQLDEGRAPREIAVITRTNQLRTALNHELRRQAGERGLLSGPEYRVVHERGGSELLVRVGDRLALRENNREPRLLNGMIGTIEQISRHGHGIALRLDDDSTRVVVPVWYLQAGYAEHAYAITGHASQGTTLEEALIVARPEDHSREWSYTAASRARGHTRHLVIGDQTARDDPEHAAASPAPATQSLEVREHGLGAMSRLEQALTRTDAQRLAQHQPRDAEFDSRRGVIPDPRLERGSIPSYEVDLNPRTRDRGRGGPGLER
jgi:conjugative relaxase-like TrwC/TraI family protein